MVEPKMTRVKAATERPTAASTEIRPELVLVLLLVREMTDRAINFPDLPDREQEVLELGCIGVSIFNRTFLITGVGVRSSSISVTQRRGRPDGRIHAPCGL